MSAVPLEPPPEFVQNVDVILACGCRFKAEVTLRSPNGANWRNLNLLASTQTAPTHGPSHQMICQAAARHPVNMEPIFAGLFPPRI